MPIAISLFPAVTTIATAAAAAAMAATMASPPQRRKRRQLGGLKKKSTFEKFGNLKKEKKSMACIQAKIPMRINVRSDTLWVRTGTIALYPCCVCSQDNNNRVISS